VLTAGSSIVECYAGFSGIVVFSSTNFEPKENQNDFGHRVNTRRTLPGMFRILL